ncbi:MAG: hypothetical protein GY887_14070 [Halieaceae bacterium]|nr:hypothetical protein [Halieaceae bacterium]
MTATVWDAMGWDAMGWDATRLALVVAAAAPACNGMTVGAVWTTACPEQISASPCSPAWLMTAA